MVKLPSYLQQNSYGIYYFRIAIPTPLRVQFGGRTEYKYSLRTSCRKEAIFQTRALGFKFNLLFKLLREKNTTYDLC